VEQREQSCQPRAAVASQWEEQEWSGSNKCQSIVVQNAIQP
jgi:hypothetical protein